MSKKQKTSNEKNTINKKTKIYRLYGINAAIDFLRPNARYTHDGRNFLTWDDPRPQPTNEEVMETLKNIKNFEDSLNTIWLEDQIKLFNELWVVPDLKCLDEYHKFRTITSEDVIKSKGKK